MEHYSVLKRREIQSHVTTWMHLEDSMLSKISQSQKTNSVKYKVSSVGSTGVKESVCQCTRHKSRGFDPWVGKMPWRRNWQPTPVFLPGKSMDRGAWRAMVCGVTKSQTWLSDWTPNMYLKENLGTSLAVQWLRLHAPRAGGPSLVAELDFTCRN